jgi:gamma-glutamyltranspeptidase/glutathione hydrolase
MAYGTMGGEGQPQTQAAVFSRYAMMGQPLQAAIQAPRWLLGRMWGAESTTLKLEARFPQRLFEDLASAGHDVEWIEAYDDAAGHAGAVVLHPDGTHEAAFDPRSNGVALAF